MVVPPMSITIPFCTPVRKAAPRMLLVRPDAKVSSGKRCVSSKLKDRKKKGWVWICYNNHLAHKLRFLCQKRLQLTKPLIPATASWHIKLPSKLLAKACRRNSRKMGLVNVYRFRRHFIRPIRTWTFFHTKQHLEKSDLTNLSYFI